MGNKLIRQTLARRVARQFAAEHLADTEAAGLAFAEHELTAEERVEAHAELKRIAGRIRAEVDGD
ncbi:hypothetical protein [Pseudomonas sp. ML96]|uniref:hypothetical protein n=1 Tax=Pseudomonas sp. ML96 TaxID=1523503 RepID=UPI0005B8CE73|nr:hypothetical protein [Pseudomonas sp. ML96]